jgi:hypothetical protein
MFKGWVYNPRLCLVLRARLDDGSNAPSLGGLLVEGSPVPLGSTATHDPIEVSKSLWARWKSLDAMRIYEPLERASRDKRWRQVERATPPTLSASCNLLIRQVSLRYRQVLTLRAPRGSDTGTGNVLGLGVGGSSREKPVELPGSTQYLPTPSLRRYPLLNGYYTVY